MWIALTTAFVGAFMIVLQYLETLGNDLPSFVKSRIGADPFTDDTDNDGLTDYFELMKLGLMTDIRSGDSNNDGIPDIEEDPDNDGLTNIQEQAHGTDVVYVDVMFTMDSSGSMSWNDRYGYRKTAAKSFVGALISGDRAGVVDFDSSARVTRPLTDNLNAVNSSINSLDSSGGTNIGAGV